MRWLIDQGAPFDLEGGDYHLTREGGHSGGASARRDATGARCRTPCWHGCGARANITLLGQHISPSI
jgi:L-aspartate oxidase